MNVWLVHAVSESRGVFDTTVLRDEDNATRFLTEVQRLFPMSWMEKEVVCSFPKHEVEE